MAVIFCDSATGSDSDDGSTWALAKATLQAAITAAGAGGTVYLADTHSESYTTAQELDLPTSGNLPVVVISSDVLTGTSVSYKEPTASQFTLDNSGVDLDLTFDGNGSFYGFWCKCEDNFYLNAGDSETLSFKNCTFEMMSFGAQIIGGQNYGAVVIADSEVIIPDSLPQNTELFTLGISDNWVINNVSFSGTTAKTNDIVQCQDGSTLKIWGCDFSAFTSLSHIVSLDSDRQQGIVVDGCKLASGVAVFSATNMSIYSDGIHATRCGGANYDLHSSQYYGDIYSEPTVKRTDGAGSFSDSYAWKVVTGAGCRVGMSYYTPWLPIPVTSTGSKTFTVYIANTSADLKDTECWLEVEYLGSSGSTLPSLATDRATDILSAGTAQTDDTSSTWGSSPTYMQSLAVTATVNKAGMARCRVGFAKASATVYVDPQVTVS